MDSKKKQDDEDIKKETECADECTEKQVDEQETQQPKKEEEPQVQNDAEEYLDMARRVQAEFENYRRRTTEEMKLKKDDGKIEAISKLLPCLDLMLKARKMIEKDQDILAGFDMIIKQFENSLNELGATKVEVVGKTFDHTTSNALAMLTVPGKEDDEVIEEISSGYTLNGRIVRYANVIVNKIQKN